jgi:hypothetical protein
MSQITVDRIAAWNNVVFLPPGDAAPAERLIRSLRLRRPVWRRIPPLVDIGYREALRIDEEAERWDGMS